MAGPVSPNLNIPFLMAGQAQPEVVINEAIVVLDNAVTQTKNELQSTAEELAMLAIALS